MPVSHIKTIDTNKIADWSGTATVMGPAGTTITVNATDMVRPSDWNSAHTLQLTGVEVASLFNFGNGLSSTTNTGGVTAGIMYGEYYEPFQNWNSGSVMVARAVGSWYFDPFYLPNGIGKGRINQFVANASISSSFFLNGANFTTSTSNASATANRRQTNYNIMAIYSQVATNPLQLTTVWSGSAKLVF